jgi:hypothetical protein
MNENTTLGAYGVEGFGEAHDLGRTTVYQEIKEGRLRSFLVGKRRLISVEAAAEWRRKREEETAGGAT